MAEIELSALSRGSTDCRIDTAEKLTKEIAAWQRKRNQTVNWQFTIGKARTKLKNLYPEIIM